MTHQTAVAAIAITDTMSMQLTASSAKDESHMYEIFTP